MGDLKQDTLTSACGWGDILRSTRTDAVALLLWQMVYGQRCRKKEKVGENSEDKGVRAITVQTQHRADESLPAVPEPVRSSNTKAAEGEGKGGPGSRAAQLDPRKMSSRRWCSCMHTDASSISNRKQRTLPAFRANPLVILNTLKQSFYPAAGLCPLDTFKNIIAVWTGDIHNRTGQVISEKTVSQIKLCP